MNHIEKMHHYIKLTSAEHSTADPYHITVGDLTALREISRTDLYGALCLAFEYGRSKGERRAAREREVRV